MNRLAFLLLVGLGVLACGPSPEARDGRPSGTLVVVVRQGPDRVPFHPGEARIQAANAQLAQILGHSIAIEVDGALLPQTHDAAEDEIAHLVEDVARDMNGLAKEDPKALAYAQKHFERLVVRYDPAESERRRDRWNRHSFGKLEGTTVDVVRAEAGWRALERGEVGSVFYQASEKDLTSRYANVLPDALPASERAAWFQFHVHGAHAEERLGSVELVTVRGCIQIASGPDAELAKQARAWLFGAGLDEFSTTYHHQQAEVEGAPAASPFRITESAFMGWLGAQLGSSAGATVEERGKVADKLWVIDFRKQDGDRFATYAFPGIDPMAFALATGDAWIAAGHPAKTKLYDEVVQPVVAESRDGETRFDAPGRSETMFYRWALADRAREDALVKGLLQRPDPQYTTAVFFATHRVLREEGAYLRFLQRFEAVPAQWKIGAEIHRVESGGNASVALIEESKRLWRDVPAARGYALYGFAVQAEHSYHAVTDWKDDLQGRPIDDASFQGFLGIGWPAFALVPTVWPTLPKHGRVRPILSAAPALLDANIRARPGAHDVARTLVDVARLLCEEHSGEAAELHAWASAEQPKRPGAGLAEVVTASKCAAAPAAKPAKVPVRDPFSGKQMKF